MEETKESYSYEDCIGDIVAYNAALQFAHWRADTVTNEHKALGDLYEAMSGLIDDFAEACMGKYGIVSLPAGLLVEDVGSSPCAKGLKLVEELKNDLETGKDDDLLNIVADMQNALHKAKYLLKEK